jgi:membrane fusion protein, multidrug efflux system
MKIRKLVIAVVIIAAVYFGYKHFFGSDAGQQAGMQMPPAQVDVVIAKKESITLWTEFSGRLEAVDNIELRPRVSGMVEKVHFKDGDMVRKGDVLFTIDQDPIIAQLKRAEGASAGAASQNILAETELNRAEKLYAAKAISKQEYDQRRANAKVGSANVKSARAEVQLAELNLGYTKVRAPITGKVGRAEVTPGNIVAEGQTILTTLVAMAPIYASFEIDENTYLRVTTPDKKSKVLLGLANNEGFPYEGKIQGFDNQINPATGTIRARAIFENKDNALIPGLFARIKIGSADPAEVILIDQKAIATDQDKKFVYVATPDNKAEYRIVTLGGEYEGKRIITSGINEGDRVVVNGIQKIMMPGAPLQISEAGSQQVKPAPVAKQEAPAAPMQEAAKPEDEPVLELPVAAPEKTVKKLPKIENVPVMLKEAAPKANIKEKN